MLIELPHSSNLSRPTNDDGILKYSVQHTIFVAFGSLFVGILLDAMGINLFRLSSMDFERNTFCIFVLGLAFSVMSAKMHRLQPVVVMLLFALTQYFQVSLGWDVQTGVLSIPRLLPIIAQLVLIIIALKRVKWRCSRSFATGWLASASLGVLGLSSLDITPIGIYQFIGFSLQLPLWVAYLSVVILPNEKYRRALQLGGWIAFLIFGLGTVIVIRLGGGLGFSSGGEGFLAARGISEFNLVLTYLILLWPFALAESEARGPIVVGITISIFIVATIFGLSRTGLFLVPALILSSLMFIYRKKPMNIIISIATIAMVTVLGVVAMPGSAQLGTDWNNRLDISSIAQVSESVANLTPGGASAKARDLLRGESLVWWQQSPIIGQGFGSFEKMSRIGFTDPHSISFFIAIELGLVGLVCFYGFLAALLSRSIRAMRLPTNSTALIAMPLSLFAFIFAAHSVGGGLFLSNSQGFSANSNNSMLLLVFLYPSLLISKSLNKKGLV